MPTEEIRVEAVAQCSLCGSPGTQLYAGLRDRFFTAPGSWAFSRCPECGFVWLSPRPVPQELYKAYLSYHTHSRRSRRFGMGRLREKASLAMCSTVPGYETLAPSRTWRQLGRLMSIFPPLREVGRMRTMCLAGIPKGSVLDVGCGAGEFLGMMQEAGWKVLGFDSDPAAARAARESFGVPVIVGDFSTADLPAESFDAVIASHVIEHVYDPVSFLSACRRVVKPGGRVVVVTPNLDSLGSRMFGVGWALLEAPRHLQLFSSATLRTCAVKAGLKVDVLRTSFRAEGFVCAASRVIQKRGRFGDSDIGWRTRFEGLAFQAGGELVSPFWRSGGEELVLVCRR